jgi:small subunit ribosomal protein S6
MRRYELMLLLRPDLEDDKLQAAVEKVTRAIVNGGGSLSKVSPWGKRRLAYDINRHREASYFLIHFDIEPSQVREIERGMLISEEILRHLVTVLEERGPADELAPAAAARATGDEDHEGAVATDLAQAAIATAAAEEDAADAELTETDAAGEPTADTIDEEADVPPADEERAEEEPS